jgi:hypothetical protein
VVKFQNVKSLILVISITVDNQGNTIMSFDGFIDTVWQDSAIANFAVKKAQRQLSQIFLELNHKPTTIYNVGHKNAASLALESNGLAVDTEVQHQQYDTILALDECFTYSDSEQEQKDSVNSVVKLLKPGGVILTSLRDYRNNPVHKRNLGDTSYVNIDNTHYVVVEINKPIVLDNQSWEQTNFVIRNDDFATAYELGKRRTLYFKQLAKYCNDAGCKQFGVLKEHFWKSPWKRSMEHIAWSRF